MAQLMCLVKENIKKETEKVLKTASDSPHYNEQKVKLNNVKYLYAELERANLSKQLSDEEELKIIEKMIQENEEQIQQLLKLNRSTEALLEQNKVFSMFLPQYASETDIKMLIAGNGMEELIGSSNNKNIGVIIKFLKERNVPFKNEVVKSIVMKS